MSWRDKTVISLFGPVRLSSSYYYCGACRQSQKPWDAALRLGARRVTAGGEEAIALAGLLTSFGRAARQTLAKLTGIHVSESTVQRVTEDAGEKLGARLAAKETFGPPEVWKWQRDARGTPCAYTGLDHISVPMQGAKGAKAESRMAAVGLIYNPQSEHDEPHPRDACPARFLAGFYELDALGRLLRRQAAQVGWDEAGQQIALSDAGAGLEQFMDQNFPLAEKELDFFHASEHVATMSAARHPADDAARQEQTHRWCHQLKHAGGLALLTEWERLDTRRWNAERSEVYRQQLQYFRHHHARMDYPRYLAHGWQIGSGPVESGCKRVVAQRLKGAGMRWGSRGADAMCHLQALLLSEAGQWDHFWTASEPKTHLRN